MLIRTLSIAFATALFSVTSLLANSIDFSGTVVSVNVTGIPTTGLSIPSVGDAASARFGAFGPEDASFFDPFGPEVGFNTELFGPVSGITDAGFQGGFETFNAFSISATGMSISGLPAAVFPTPVSATLDLVQTEQTATYTFGAVQVAVPQTINEVLAALQTPGTILDYTYTGRIGQSGGFTLNAQLAVPVASVPLPATALLMGSVAALGFAASRRAKSAARPKT